MNTAVGRIALVVSGDVFAPGGVESSTRRIARALAARGPFAVDVLMLRSDLARGPDAEFYDARPVDERDGVRYYELPAYSAIAQPPERAFALHLGLVNLVRRNHYRLLHGMYASTAGFHAAYAGAECGVPVVVGLRGNDIHADVFSGHRFAQLQWALNHAARVTAVSSEALRRADVLTGCGAVGRVILNSIDPASYHEGALRLADGAPVIGTLAKIRSKKAVGTLVTAFHRVLKDWPEAHLVLVGGLREDSEPEVREAIALHGLADRVTFGGSVQRADAARYIRGMDVFVHPALHEGCPNAILEAMLAGVPIVATAVGAIPEVITHGVEGILVDPAGSPEALGEGISAMLRADRGAFVDHARRKLAARFTTEREIGELVEVYESCLPASGAGALPVAGPSSPRAIGYASETTGGGDAPAVDVATPDELRRAVEGDDPKVVRIHGVIGIDGHVDLGGNTTVEGAGSGAGLLGGGLRVLGRRNVIIRNLTIGLPEGVHCVTVQGSHLVWIDHNELYGDRRHDKKFYRGLVNVTHGSDLVTVSWNVLRDQFLTMLVGHSDDNAAEDGGRLRVTLHHNWFRDVASRTPSIRFGTLHAFNNVFERVAESGVNVRMGAAALVEANVFTHCGNAVTSLHSRYGGSALLRGNDMGGASADAPAAGPISVGYPYHPDSTARLKDLVARAAGPFGTV
jgi:pectate lyase/glycosyltransferase involved in cell wall biosynthesis